MKQCPACKTTYTDETLRFCLADGASLGESFSEMPSSGYQVGSPISEETIVMPSGGGQTTIEISQPGRQTSPPPQYQPAATVPGGSSGSFYKFLMAAIGFGILALLAAAVGTFVYFNINKADKSSVVTNNEVKTQTQPSTPQKDDKDELRDQIANLEKLLNDQKKNGQPANIPLNLPNQPATITTARVNSPGDGFLVLRSSPNSKTGAELLRIPHGSTVTVGACINGTRIVNKAGRWCRASYDGYSGWVFDAFLIY